MTSEIILETEQIKEKINVKKTDWWYIFAVTFMSGGVAGIIVGHIFTFIMWLLHQEIIQFSLQNITNILFYLSLPMLFLGACCLDKVEGKKETKITK